MNLPSEQEISGALPDLGLLLIAHREAFVVQSSLVRPLQLVDGFRTMAGSLQPAVAVVTGPNYPADSEWSWPESVIAHMSRIAPSFVYRPDVGCSWAERFRLSEVVDQEKPWVVVNWSNPCSDGTGKSREEAVTFAHAAALDVSFRGHFLTIPPEAWRDDQIEVGTYLSSSGEASSDSIPFIWVLGPEQTPQRAIVTRELVRACRDRQRAWRILQELAGIESEYVRLAVEQTRQEVETAARAEIEAIGERERSEGAAQAIERIVALFTDPAALAMAPSPIVIESPEQPEVREAPEKTTAPVEAEIEEEFSAEPYIDTYLCTSCNECINLNPLLFKYNQEKQAEIGDVSAGTFLELVKAAEACPAKCIHPGSPREYDATATAAVIARAEVFQ